MSTKLMPAPHFRGVNASTGAVLALGKVYTYQAGTSTPLASYTDSTGGTPNANPVILDANGEATIWLTPGTLYKIKVTDASDVQQYVMDNVSVDSTGTLAIASGGTGATTKAGAFDALSPMTTAGDVIYGGASGTGTRLARGTATQLLHSGTTPSFSAVDLAADVTGTLPLGSGGTGQTSQTNAANAMQQKNTAFYIADGAITQKQGLVFIAKSSAAALTLAAPTAGTDDGKEMTLLATTAFAHTVTQASPGFNNGGAASDVGTFGGAIADGMTIIALNGIWYVKPGNNKNVTLA